MSIAEKLMSSKDALSSLLTYANGVTGEDDSNIGEAVKRLADGYGGGGIPIDRPFKIVEVTGACTIDVSELGDYGIAVKISDDGIIGRPILFNWQPGDVNNALIFFRDNNTLASSIYASYFSYNSGTHSFSYNGSTVANYNIRGTWLL